jgi:hypothetical protein
MPAPKRLADELARIADRVRKSAKSRLNEQNTKASLIEPVLRLLGWYPEDVDEVVREFRSKPKASPVDYGLFTLRTPSSHLSSADSVLAAVSIPQDLK